MPNIGFPQLSGQQAKLSRVVIASLALAATACATDPMSAFKADIGTAKWIDNRSAPAPFVCPTTRLAMMTCKQRPSGRFTVLEVIPRGEDGFGPWYKIEFDDHQTAYIIATDKAIAASDPKQK